MPKLNHANHSGISFEKIGDELRATVTASGGEGSLVTEDFQAAGTSSGGVHTRTLTESDDGKVLYHYGGDSPTISVPLLSEGFTLTFMGVFVPGDSLVVDVTGAYDEIKGPLSLLMGEDGAPVSVALTVTKDAAGTGVALQIVGSGSRLPPNAQTGTSYTVALSDAHRPVTMNNSSANEAVIPTDSVANHALGTLVPITRLGSGVTSVAAATGVVLNGVSAGSFQILERYQTATAMKIAANTWVLSLPGESSGDPGNGGGDPVLDGIDVRAVDVSYASGTDSFGNDWDINFPVEASVSNVERIVGFRFQVNIPQGATINSATLTKYQNQNSDWAAGDNRTLGAEQADNPGIGTSNADCRTRRQNIGTSHTWANTGTILNSDPVPTGDIAALIQQIVNRSGWSSGNHIMLWCYHPGNGATNQQCRSVVSQAAGVQPRLEVGYEYVP